MQTSVVMPDYVKDALSRMEPDEKTPFARRLFSAISSVATDKAETIVESLRRVALILQEVDPDSVVADTEGVLVAADLFEKGLMKLNESCRTENTKEVK